nr:MAG TPA: hypothetical protein [Caudoviricetes sp.]
MSHLTAVAFFQVNYIFVIKAPGVGATFILRFYVKR